MESLSLLPALQALPSIEGAGKLTPAEMMPQVRAMDRGNFAIEVSLAVEEGMETLFDARNVSDDLAKAWGAVYPNVKHESVYDHYLAMPEGSVTGFISPLKGRLAEFKAESVMEERFPGWNFTHAPNPTQPDWDLWGIGPEGQEMPVQVKTGGASYAGDVLERIEESPDLPFAVSSNLYDLLTKKAPELSERLTNIDKSNDEFTTEVKDGLETLAGNMGIDVPDSIGEALPFVAEVILGIKLIHSIVTTERSLKGEELTDRLSGARHTNAGVDVEVWRHVGMLLGGSNSRRRRRDDGLSRPWVSGRGVGRWNYGRGGGNAAKPAAPTPRRGRGRPAGGRGCGRHVLPDE